MRRFLVLQTVILQGMKGSEYFQEPVCDFDTFDEADEWVSNQEKPSIYLIEDQFEDEFADEMTDDHDFGAYELRDEEEFLDEEDDYPPFDGDGDAD